MNRWKREAALTMAFTVCVGFLLVGFGGAPAAAQQISVDGDFAGTLDGYDGGGTDQSHVVTVEGSFTVTGENAQNVRVTVAPGQQMVLNQGSVEAFVEGDEEVSFDQTNRGNQVILRTDEIPSGTTIQITFEVVFTGGTAANELNAGSVTVNYETAGGTEDQASFDAPTDTSASADNRINSLQSEINASENWRLVGIGGGVFGVLGIIGMVVLYLRCCREDDGPTTPSGPNL